MLNKRETFAHQSKRYESTPTFRELKSVLMSQPNEYPDFVPHGQTGLIKASSKAQGLVTKSDDRPGWFAIWDDSQKVGSYRSTMTSLNSRKAVKLCADKERTKAALHRVGIRVPPSSIIKKAVELQALQDCRFPLWIKPTRGAGGVGHSFAKDYLDLAEAAEKILAQGGTALVEPFLDGVDVRAVVIGGRFICAASRINAHVIGDGLRSVSHLISDKNRYRKRHPHLARFPVKNVSEVADTVPKSGEFVFLSSVSNLHKGGDSVDITDRLSPRMVHFIETAARAVRGGGCLGVDLLTTSFTDQSQASLIEINTGANMLTHHYPVFGASHNVADAIVEEMVKRSSAGRMRRRQRAPFWSWTFTRARLARWVSR